MAALAAVISTAPIAAQELSPEEVMARKAADPLGDVMALMIDRPRVGSLLPDPPRLIYSRAE